MAIKKLNYLDINPATRRERAVGAIQSQVAILANTSLSQAKRDEALAQIQRLRAWVHGNLDTPPPVKS